MCLNVEKGRKGFISIPFEVRFWEKVNKNTGSDCWLWTGASRNGYGQIYVDGKMQKAHRVTWEIVNGKSDPNLNACHTCDTPLCVNPDHIFIGTQRDNLRDAMKKGRLRIPGVNMPWVARQALEKEKP